MKRILPNRGRRPKRRHTVCLGLALWAVGGVVSAATEQTPPDGMPAGPVFFAPWFESEFLLDDNVFRRSEDQGPEDDFVTTLRGGVTAYVPIRMSELQIGYQGSTFFYRDAVFKGTDSHTGSVVFNLNFSNHDTLILEENYTDGVTELREVDDGGNPVGQGIPFVRNQFAVEWVRSVSQQPSWRARVERVDHRYASDSPLDWLDYEGWAVGYEYAQPIYRRGALIGSYDARRQDHFEAGRPVPDNVPLRREEFDSVKLGFRGLIGRNQPLLVALGYGRLGFRDVQTVGETSDFRGLVGELLWRLPLGGVSNMDVSMSRRPLALSSRIFNTYYVINELRFTFDRRFREVSRYGAILLASNIRLGDALTTAASTVGCNDVFRRYQRQQVQGYWEWFIQPRVALRMTAAHNRRDSNCDLASYRSNGLGMTFKVGWF